MSLCNGTKRVQAELLGSLAPSHFYDDNHKLIFQRIRKLCDGEIDNIPNVEDLAQDIALSDDAKKVLVASRNISYAETKKDAVIIIKTLDDYRKGRTLSTTLADAASKMKGEVDEKDGPKDIDEILDLTIERLVANRINKELDFTNPQNNRPIVEKILNDDFFFIPTGLECFDTKNAGFPRGGLIALGASPGAGKTALCINLAVNQYLMGYSPMIFSFEMNAEEIWGRIISCYTGIAFDQVCHKRLSKKQKSFIMEKMAAFAQHGIDKKCTFEIICPDTSIKFSELQYRVKYKKKDILYIDYISLLEPENPKHEQFRQLQEISRLAKLAAKQQNIPIVLLSQINNQKELKYSGGLKENANLVWVWDRDDEAKAARELRVSITKARNQQMFDFVLKEQFDVMRVTDISNNSMVGDDDDDNEAPMEKKKKSDKLNIKYDDEEDL